MLPSINGEFRTATDPNLRFTPSGMAVCEIRAVATSRKKNDRDEWVDDKTCWVTLVAFKKLAENMAESIAKGELIVVNGRLQTEDWEDKDGVKRTSLKVLLDTIGPSIAFNPARTIKSERPSGGGGESKAPAGEDPWAPAPKEDEPPF
jgi:single-strand DNA-binding protein